MLYVTPIEKKLITTVIKFVNIREIKSTDQVQELFRKLPLSPVFKVLQPGEEGAYYNDQAELRAWLKEIAGKGRSARKHIGDNVSRRLGTVDTRVTYKEGGLSYEIALSGVQAAYSYAVALLLDKDRDITSRLGYCKAPGCGKFHISWTGKPKHYCNNKHRLKYDYADAKDRVRRYREKLKQRRDKNGTKKQ